MKTQINKTIIKIIKIINIVKIFFKINKTINMKLIICEKPAQAREYSNVLSKYTNSEFKKEDGYYINSNNIIISYAIGHLIELAYPELYDQKYKAWKMEDLPCAITQTDYIFVVGF